jgi:sugar phosphate isomerase/epimerase
MGIDPIRFLEEFVRDVAFVHAKDTAFDDEDLYDTGWEVPPFDKLPSGSKTFWRYTIPGEGRMDWKTGFSILEKNGYQGIVSIEHEDFAYMDSPAKIREGLIRSRDFLASV